MNEKLFIQNLRQVNHNKIMKTSQKIFNKIQKQQKQNKETKILTLDKFQSLINRIENLFFKMKFMMKDDLLTSLINNNKKILDFMKGNYSKKYQNLLLNDFILLLNLDDKNKRYIFKYKKILLNN